MYKKIRVPLDGSALTEAVLTFGEEFAEMEGAEKNAMMASASPVARYSVDHTTPVSDFMETLETQSLIYKQSIQNADINLSVPARAKPVTETIQ